MTTHSAAERGDRAVRIILENGFTLAQHCHTTRHGTKCFQQIFGLSYLYVDSMMSRDVSDSSTRAVLAVAKQSLLFWQDVRILGEAYGVNRDSITVSPLSLF